MKKFLLVKVFYVILIVTTFFSCSSLQDVSMSVELTAQSEDIHRIEGKYVLLDANRLLGKDKTSEYDTAIKDLIADIDTVLDVPGLQSASSSRLQALKGLAYLLKGNKGKASDRYKASIAEYKGDAQGIILGRRLGLSSEEIEKACDTPALLELQIAIEKFESNDFMNSVAKFDSAFLELPSYYKDAYLPVRDEAWRLRLIDTASKSDNLMDILKLNEISVGQFLVLAQQSTNLLFKFIGDKRYSEKELFKTVFDNGILTPVSGEEERVLMQGDSVTRIICARILWKLYVELKENISPNKYSSAYRASSIPSPVSDVDVSNPDFDAVLGCVENEIMSLVDGEKFEPEKLLSASELDEYLKNVK
ncbi:MAG: hypothetical protein K6F69_03925 [Treponema sp.]|nr:hypothetical protein [Treponema sp.]